MELWLAFTGFEQMEKAHEYPIKGVLTNPTLLSLPKLHWKETVSRLNTFGTLPLGLQVVSTSMEEMIAEIKLYHQLVDRKQLIIKLPFCRDALRVLPFIRQMGHAINVAAVCSFGQAIVALESEPEYLSIYVGRVSDGGGDGVALVSAVKGYALRCGKRTLIQAASIRTARQVEEVAVAGADAAVLTLPVIEQTMKNELTDQSIHEFARDWASVS
jgi:TalC/MipB family fructose-6-phosphate aldolase